MTKVNITTNVPGDSGCMTETRSDQYVLRKTELVFNSFIYSKPVERSENSRGMREFRKFNNSMGKGVLNMTKSFKLTVWKIIVE